MAETTPQPAHACDRQRALRMVRLTNGECSGKLVADGMRGVVLVVAERLDSYHEPPKRALSRRHAPFVRHGTTVVTLAAPSHLSHAIDR